jgi:uncharacterized protein (DUF302 family)
MANETAYGYVKKLDGVPFDEAKNRIVEELKKEGFGILSEIDVSGTLKSKIDVEFRPYAILGACNPHLANKALGVDGQIGLLLPCNVVVQTSDGGSIVSIADPKAMSELTDNPDLDPVVKEADERLARVIEAV